MHEIKCNLLPSVVRGWQNDCVRRDVNPWANVMRWETEISPSSTFPCCRLSRNSPSMIHTYSTRGRDEQQRRPRRDNLSTQLGQEERDDVLCHPSLRCSGCQRQRQHHLLLGNIQTPTKEDVERKTIVGSIIIIIITRKLESCTPGVDLGYVTAAQKVIGQLI